MECFEPDPDSVADGELVQPSPPAGAPRLGARVEGPLLWLGFPVEDQSNSLALGVSRLQDSKTPRRHVQIAEGIGDVRARVGQWSGVAESLPRIDVSGYSAAQANHLTWTLSIQTSRGPPSTGRPVMSQRKPVLWSMNGAASTFRSTLKIHPHPLQPGCTPGLTICRGAPGRPIPEHDTRLTVGRIVDHTGLLQEVDRVRARLLAILDTQEHRVGREPPIGRPPALAGILGHLGRQVHGLVLVVHGKRDSLRVGSASARIPSR